jgi:hypothetical protein
MHNNTHSAPVFCNFKNHMSQHCGHAVVIVAESFVKLAQLYTLSPALFALFMNRANFVHKLNTANFHLSSGSSQAIYLLRQLKFSTFSTMPINTTNLIKE